MNKTVLSVMTQMRNITTAVMFATANWHIGKGASVADNFRILFDDLLNKTKDPQKLRETLQEALENGAIDSSTIAQELEQVIPESKNPFTDQGTDPNSLGNSSTQAGRTRRWRPSQNYWI